MSVMGLTAITKALAKHKIALGKGLRVGLHRGGLFLQRESMKLVPVQLDHLRTSANTRMEGTGLDSAAVVSYGTDYAVYVHENLEAAHGKEFNAKHAAEIAHAAGTKAGTAAGGMFNRAPDQQAKFLEKPIREKRGRIEQIVLQAVRENLP